jgi:hypothetical protein
MSTKAKERIELLQGTLDLLILQTLRPGPAHGYAIAKTIELKSADVLQVEQGSLYPALHRLIGRDYVPCFAIIAAPRARSPIIVAAEAKPTFRLRAIQIAANPNCPQCAAPESFVEAPGEISRTVVTLSDCCYKDASSRKLHYFVAICQQEGLKCSLQMVF